MWTADEIHLFILQHLPLLCGVLLLGLVVVKLLLPRLTVAKPVVFQSRDSEVTQAISELQAAARQRQQERFAEEARLAAERRGQEDAERRLQTSLGGAGGGPGRAQLPASRGGREYNPLAGHSEGPRFRPSGFARPRC
eukprot:EG_transcript_40436